MTKLASISLKCMRIGFSKRVYQPQEIRSLKKNLHASYVFGSTVIVEKDDFLLNASNSIEALNASRFY